MQNKSDQLTTHTPSKPPKITRLDKCLQKVSHFFQYVYYPSFHTILKPTKEHGALYLGDVASARNITKLKRKKINTVLTIGIEMNLKYKKNDNIKHHFYPAYDSALFELNKYFGHTFVAIENGLKNGNVLVHCVAGISRSSSIIIAYLMKKNNWSYHGKSF